MAFFPPLDLCPRNSSALILLTLTCVPAKHIFFYFFKGAEKGFFIKKSCGRGDDWVKYCSLWQHILVDVPELRLLLSFLRLTLQGSLGDFNLERAATAQQLMKLQPRGL